MPEFKPGELTAAEASDLNWMRSEVVRISNLRVAGSTLRLYRGPANIVIESIAAVPAASGSGSGSGAGSGGSGGSGAFPGDLVTIQFDALSDVQVNITDFSVTCVDGKISATLSIETVKTYERVFVTGPDLSVSVACGTGGPC